jgi:hypothetical protein
MGFSDLKLVELISPEGTNSYLISLITKLSTPAAQITQPLDSKEVIQIQTLIDQLLMPKADRELALSNVSPDLKSKAIRFWYIVKSGLLRTAKEVLLFNLDYYKSQNVQAYNLILSLYETVTTDFTSSVVVPQVQVQRSLAQLNQPVPDPNNVQTGDLADEAEKDNRIIDLMDTLEKIQDRQLAKTHLHLDHISFLLTRLLQARDFFVEREKWTRFAPIIYDCILRSKNSNAAMLCTELYLYITDEQNLHGLYTYLHLSESIDNPHHQARLAGAKLALERNGISIEDFVVEQGVHMPRALGSLLVKLALLRHQFEDGADADRLVATEIGLFIHRNQFESEEAESVISILKMMLPLDYELTHKLLEGDGHEQEI